MQAITSVGEILENYDTDKQIPVFGFGAKIPGVLMKRPTHCFAINGNIFDPELPRIRGVIDGIILILFLLILLSLQKLLA